MKHLILFLMLISSAAFGQLNLVHNQLLIDCQEKWVAFPPNKDSLMVLGFVYIDSHAGLSLHVEGTLKTAGDGKFIISKRPASQRIVNRLPPTQVRVAQIPTSMFKELEIMEIPDWLKVYNTPTAQRNYQIGFTYNAWGLCGTALTFLDAAREADPKIRGLAAERAFSYNCMEQFIKAIDILTKALEENADEAYLYKELFYAQMRSNELDQAAASLTRALAVCKDTTFHAENCYNVLDSYFMKKDKQGFNSWIAEARKWNSASPQTLRSISAMETAISKL